MPLRELGLAMAKGPPIHWIIVGALILLGTIAFAAVSDPTASLYGFLTGSVIGTINLAVFLVAWNKIQATGNAWDWTIPAKKVAVSLALASWAIGVWNIFYFCVELTR